MSFTIDGMKTDAHVSALLQAHEEGKWEFNELVADLLHTIAAAARGDKKNFAAHISVPIADRVEYYESTRRRRAS